MRESLGSPRVGFAGVLLAAALILALPSQSLADVRTHNIWRYIRWKRDGQLDYRLLQRRYMPVSSFSYGGNWYGYPYSAHGGMLNPPYDGTDGFFPFR